ncbi:DNA topoisomerase [Sulfurospirillum sp. hDNRA2]|uniref:DNA topoisomerase n=1 Tax=Sulfurospirillum sp. hDNRA2 TaxID=3237298 RepID=UPI0020B7C574|nr:DNA topoisomerase [Sulfurospirillum sp. DNRA8]MCP3653254.1 DNA topoisomerase [Sulfurospirillum sp. DNRA8]MCR1812106.1 DNA topoisomerase [Sulfurospirillum sp. DNRA8]
MNKKILILTEKREAGCDMAATLKDAKLGSNAEALNNEGKSRGYLEGDQYVFCWAAGHLYSQVQPKEINPSYGLYQRLATIEDYKMPQLINEIKLKPSPQDNKERQRELLKKLLYRSDIEKIIIATDADAEGEAIGRNMIFQIHPNIKLPIFRFWNKGSFKVAEAVQKAMNNLEPYNASKYEAEYASQMARSNCDYLVGMKITKTLTDQYGKPLYTGRVKSVIISLIGNRELEIEAFKKNGAKPFFYIDGKIKDLELSHFFHEEVEDFNEDGTLESKQVKTRNYFNQNKANTVINELKAAQNTGKVEKNETTPTVSKSRPLPLSGTDFASEMMGKYKITLTQCNEILDYLRNEGFTTYPGTNGRYFSFTDREEVETAFNSIQHYFASQGTPIDSPKFSTNAGLFNDKKAAEQNHTPLSVTSKIPGATDLKNWEAHKLPRLKEAYELIAKRIMVSFLPDDEIIKQHLIIDIAGHKFEITGQKALKQGWRTFIDQEIKDSTFNSDLKAGDRISLDSVKLKDGKTKCPSKYTVKTLIDTLLNVTKVIDDQIKESDDPDYIKVLKETKKLLKKAEGIGTDRTREPIINELIENKMMEATGKSQELSLLTAGWEIYKVLPKQLKSVILTGNWENGFEQIRRGELTYQDFISSVDKTIMNEMIPYIFENLGKEVDVKTKSEVVELEFLCPLCQSNLLEGEKFFKCSSTEKCNFIVFKDQSRTLGSTLGIDELMQIIHYSSKENPYIEDPALHGVYFDPTNKYFLTPVWNKSASSSAAQNNDNASGDIVETPKTFKKGSRFVYKSFRGKDLTLAAVEKLFDGKSVTLTRKSEKGAEYKVKCTLKADGTLNTELVK